MKNKISSLVIIVAFGLSFCFVINQACFTKKEIRKNKIQKIVTIVENKNALYSVLLNYKKEDYSYKEYFYEDKKNYNNISYKQKSIEDINMLEEEIKEEVDKIVLEENKTKSEDETRNEIVDEKIDEELLEIKDIKTDNEEQEEDTGVETTELKNEIKEMKNGFVSENNITYYYEDDIKVTGIKNIDGINHYFSASGRYLGTNNIKVIDVSYYQSDIDWDLFVSESDCYGVILRLGYYNTLDKKFERNINELKRLNIPYGIYLFSYSTTLKGSNKEALFTNDMIDKYDLNPTLGIYYDIEAWKSSNDSSSDIITKDMYDNIISNYINDVSNHVNYKYKVKVYSGRWYAMNRLGLLSKSYVDWVAEYNKTCKYDGKYSMWQYTSKGSVAGISGNVDISYIINN